MVLGTGDAEIPPANYRLVVVSLTAESRSEFCQMFEKRAPLTLKQRSAVVSHLVNFLVGLAFDFQLQVVLELGQARVDAQQAARLH